jgi:galactose mutarotase-like enzyme
MKLSLTHQSIWLPNANVGIVPVQDTETIHSYMGGVVGRYANRISFGTFEIDGNTYHVPENKGNSTLHGGWVGMLMSLSSMNIF